MKRLLICIFLLMASAARVQAGEAEGTGVEREKPADRDRIDTGELRETLRSEILEERRMLRDQLRQELRQSMARKKNWRDADL